MHVKALLLHILALLWASSLIRVDFQYRRAPNCVYEVVENGHSKIILAY